jgi:hypothetical protein
MKECLKTLVESVDTAGIDPTLPGVAARYCVEISTQSSDGTMQTCFLSCQNASCSASAIYVSGYGLPRVDGVDFEAEDPEYDCVQSPSIGCEKLPDMPDDNSCLPTAMSYLVSSKLGRAVSVHAFDQMLARIPGQLPSREGMLHMNMQLLESGYTLESVQPLETARISPELLKFGTTLYEDFITALLQGDVSAESRIRTTTDWTEQKYEEYLGYLQRNDETYKKFRDDGVLIYTYENITVESIARRLRAKAIIAALPGENGTTHAVVIEGIQRIAHGGVKLSYFNPKNNSEIETRRERTLEDILDLQSGLSAYGLAARDNQDTVAS